MNLIRDNTNDNENRLSETSDNRPYTHLFQDNITDNENIIQRQSTTPQPPSHLTHDTTESVQDILTNPPNTSITDSNVLQVPTRNITEHTDHLFSQENPSTKSVTNTIDTQPPQTHHTIQRNYDPPPPPSENSIHSTPHNSPQQGTSNTFSTINNPYMELSSTQLLHQYKLLKHYNTLLLNHLYHPLLLLY